MVLSSVFTAIPYKLAWQAVRFFGRQHSAMVYIAEPMDWIIWRQIQKHIRQTVAVAARPAAQSYLRSKGIAYHKLPVFPESVIMFRHATHRFPEKRIVKIGMNHGAYRFKRFTKTKNYLAFDVYMLNSSKEASMARERGIGNTVVTGSPKMDPLFDGTISGDYLAKLGERLGLNPDKKTVMFSATWDKSGLSAVDKWSGKLSALCTQHNVLVTLHPWVSKQHFESIRQTSGVKLIDDPDLIPYMALSDVLVGDTSSVIGEFCALNKPIITFKVDVTERLNKEIPGILEEISWRVDTFEQLEKALPHALAEPQKHDMARENTARMMFDDLDGKAGRRAAQVICEKIATLGLS